MADVADKRTTGFLLVISAGSGTGKSTVCQQILQQHPKISLSISYTTRSPRGNEVDGIHYHFVNRETFQEMINKGDLLEWAEIHGNFYGTGRRVTTNILEQNKDLLLDIDVQGARSIKEAFPSQAILIFLLPPSWEAMKERLKGRGTEDESKIQRRLQTALTELPVAQAFDYLVINDQLQQAVDTIMAIRQAEAVRQFRMQGHLDKIIAEMG